MSGLEPEILVTIAIRLPQTDRAALGEHLAPVMAAAVAAGGISTTVSLQSWDPDGEEDDE